MVSIEMENHVRFSPEDFLQQGTVLLYHQLLTDHLQLRSVSLQLQQRTVLLYHQLLTNHLQLWPVSLQPWPVILQL